MRAILYLGYMQEPTGQPKSAQGEHNWAGAIPKISHAPDTPDKAPQKINEQQGTRQQGQCGARWRLVRGQPGAVAVV